MMTLPADQPTPEHTDLTTITDSEKIEIMREQLAWLCWHVENMLKMAGNSPMGRMAMNQMMKRARND